MKPHSRRPTPSPAGFALLPFLLLLSAQPLAAQSSRPQPTLDIDLDLDGIPERIQHASGRSIILSNDVVQSPRPATTPATFTRPADFQFPDGILGLDASGKDNGLRLVDLNDDGFLDLIQSNPDGYSIHLWNRVVQPHLGWTRGWSQFVRSGPPSAAPDDPPSLVGTTVSRKDGDLVIQRDQNAASPPRRISVRDLIALRIPPPLSPDEALRSMHVPPGFEVSLVAAEPLVIDPVHFDWDDSGRLWVVEMRDYPLGIDGKGRPGGQVRILEDRDGDGRMDHGRTFLSNLPFPSSVLPFRQGALVAAAPNLILAEDTDHDGLADRQTPLFTGFTEGNQQHRFNGFEWGLDGWLYLANGDSGGTIHSPRTGQSLRIGGRDLRVDPDSGAMETVSAQTQYGRRRDDWGNWFGNNNPTWLWHVTLPEHYLRRNPAVSPRRVSQVLANYPDSTRTFPRSTPQLRPNQPWSLNHVTSGCSPTPCRDDLFGPEFATSVFISEPVHNVIHREVLEPHGTGFHSHRAPSEPASEFLASSDPWFRPVTTRFGPDGALYVADMYRFILEHPEWISAEMQARVNLRAGEDRGRIYRIAPRNAPRRPFTDLSRLDTPRLVAALDSPSGWQRDRVQRLLVERQDPAAIPHLRPLLKPVHRPQVRVQALATLGLLQAIDPQLLTQVLSDPHPQVRRQALIQSESLAQAHPDIVHSITQLARDPDPAVRLQTAFSLGAFPLQHTEAALRELLALDPADETLRIAVQTALPQDSGLFRSLKAGETPPPPPASPVLKPSSPDRAAVLASYLQTQETAGDQARGHTLFTQLCAPCHRLRGEGAEVGPGLDMVSSRPTPWLLAAILDPNQAVEARYRAWSIKLTSGETLEAIVATETANNLVLRYAGAPDQPVLRSRIQSLEPLPRSLMPAGFESALEPGAMADLLSWIRAR